MSRGWVDYVEQPWYSKFPSRRLYVLYSEIYHFVIFCLIDSFTAFKQVVECQKLLFPISGHIFLCFPSFQSSFWHSFEQYSATLQPLHRRSETFRLSHLKQEPFFSFRDASFFATPSTDPAFRHSSNLSKSFSSSERSTNGTGKEGAMAALTAYFESLFQIPGKAVL